MKKIVFASILSLPLIAHSAPSYLDCSVAEESSDQRFSVKLDEANGKITHTHDNGSAFNAEGFFSANTISYKTIGVISGVSVVEQYEIDRENLSITKVTRIESLKYSEEIAAKDFIAKGKCKIAKVKKRKI